MTARLARDLAVLSTAGPIDLDAAWATVRSRVEQEPMTAPVERKRSRPGRFRMIAAALVVAIGLGAGGVAVANRYVVVTEEGTRLEQLFEGTTQDATWTVSVSQSGDGKACVSVTSKQSSGGICGDRWDEEKTYPSSTASPVKGSARVQGEAQWLLVVVSPADREAAIASNWPDGTRSVDKLSELPGVQESPATLQGVEYKVYAVMVPRSYADWEGDEAHVPFFE